MPVRSSADGSSSNHIPELDDFERATLEKSKSRLKQQQKSADTIWTVREGPSKTGENYKKAQKPFSSSKTGTTRYQKNLKTKSEYSSKSKYGYDSYSGPQSLFLPGRFASLISSNSSTSTNTLNSTSSGSTTGKKSFLENPIFETALKNWTLPRVQLYCKDPDCLFNQQKQWGSHHDQEHHRDYQQDLSDLNPNPSVTTESRSLAFIPSNANGSCCSSAAPSLDRNYSFAYGYYEGRDNHTLKSLPSIINSPLVATEVESYFPRGEQMPENMTILQRKSDGVKNKVREGVYVQSSLRKQGMYSFEIDGGRSGSGRVIGISPLDGGLLTPKTPLADKPPSTESKGNGALGIDIVVTPPNHTKSVQNTIISGKKPVDLPTSVEELEHGVHKVKTSTQNRINPCTKSTKEVLGPSNTVVTLACNSATTTKSASDREINTNNLTINAVGESPMKSTGSTSSKGDSALDSGCNSPNSFLLPSPNRFQSSSSSSASSTGSSAASTESYTPSESSGCGINRKNNKITPVVNTTATTAPIPESKNIIQELKPGEKDPELEYKAYSKWSGGGQQGQQSSSGNNSIYPTNSSGVGGGYLVPSYAQGLPIIPPSPYCPNCSGILPSAGIPSQNPLDTLSSDGSRLKDLPAQGFWKLNKFYPYPLQRDHSFHSVGGFTLNGQYNVKTPQKPSIRRFCSSHKISLVVSTFSVLVTLGLLITLLLMKKRGMMATMMDS